MDSCVLWSRHLDKNQNTPTWWEVFWLRNGGTGRKSVSPSECTSLYVVAFITTDLESAQVLTKRITKNKTAYWCFLDDHKHHPWLLRRAAFAAVLDLTARGRGPPLQWCNTAQKKHSMTATQRWLFPYFSSLIHNFYNLPTRGGWWDGFFSCCLSQTTGWWKANSAREDGFMLLTVRSETIEQYRIIKCCWIVAKGFY